MQIGNWQRAGGKGSKPQPVRKPRDKAKIPTLAEFEAKKKKLREDRERHNQRKKVSGGD